MTTEAGPGSAENAVWPSMVIFVGASVWGLYWLPLREIEAAGLGGAWAVALFNGLPVLVLAPWFVLARAGAGWRRSVFAGIMTGAGMALYAIGLVETTVVRATLLFYLTPVWSTLIGWAWLGDPIRWRRWAAIVLGLGGMLFLLSGAEAGGSKALNVGDATGLASGIVWGVGITALRRWPDLPVVATALFQFLFASLLAALGAILLGREIVAGIDWTYALMFGSAGSLLFIMPSLLAIFWAARHVDPGRAGLLMMSEVLVAVVSASLLIPEEAMGSLEWLGATLIIAACLFEVRGDRRPAQQSKPA